MLSLSLLVIASLFGCARTTFSQQTSSSTQSSDADRRAQLVAALERAQDEVHSARSYIASLEAQVKTKQDRIDALDQRDAARVEVQHSMEAEIANLKLAIESQKKDLAIKESEAEYLKKELSKANTKLATARRQRTIFAVVAATLAAIVIAKR